MIIHKLKVASCLFIVSALAGCSGSPVKDVIVEPGIIKESLVTEQFLEQEIGMAPYIVGPYLLIKQDQNRVDRVVFSVYNSKDLSYLGSLGERGREGPDTFYGASYWGQYIEREGDYLIWVNDPPRFRVSLINITKSLELGKTIIERHINHKPDYDFMNALFVLDSVGLAGHQPGYHTDANQGPLVMLKGEEFDVYGEYPIVNNILDEERWNKGATFNSISLAMKPDQSRFAVAMSYYDRLDVFDGNGELISSFREPEKYAQYNYSDIITPSKSIPKKYREYYAGVGSTENWLYLIYTDIPIEEIREFHPSTIRVFDWDGNLRAELACPNQIWNISVDEQNGYLYGGSYQEESLFRYDISSVLSRLFEKQVD